MLSALAFRDCCNWRNYGTVWLLIGDKFYRGGLAYYAAFIYNKWNFCNGLFLLSPFLLLFWKVISMKRPTRWFVGIFHLTAGTGFQAATSVGFLPRLVIVLEEPPNTSGNSPSLENSTLCSTLLWIHLYWFPTIEHLREDRLLWNSNGHYKRNSVEKIK